MIRSYPFDGQTLTESQYSRMFRELHGDTIVTDNALSGFRVQTAGGLNLSIQAGQAFLRGHFTYNDAPITIAVPAGGATQRNDLVALRLNPAVNSISLVVLQGDAVSAPAPLQTDEGIFDLPLARVFVGAGSTAITTPDIADARVFSRHEVQAWTFGNQPASPAAGTLGYNITGNWFEYYHPTYSEWLPIVPFTVSTSITSVQNSLTASETLRASVDSARAALLPVMEAQRDLGSGHYPYSEFVNGLQSHFLRRGDLIMCQMQGAFRSTPSSSVTVGPTGIIGLLSAGELWFTVASGLRPAERTAFEFTITDDTLGTYDGGWGSIYPTGEVYLQYATGWEGGSDRRIYGDSIIRANVCYTRGS